MSENRRQSKIYIVINYKSQDSTAKHLSSDGLFHYKFIIHCDSERTFKIGEHFKNNNNNNDRLTAFDPGQPG